MYYILLSIILSIIVIGRWYYYEYYYRREYKLRLLNIVLNNINSVKKHSGLCFLIRELCYIDKIHYNDLKYLERIFYKNKPFFINVNFLDRGYWWNKGEIRPRKEFIEKLIKKYS